MSIGVVTNIIGYYQRPKIKRHFSRISQRSDGSVFIDYITQGVIWNENNH